MINETQSIVDIDLSPILFKIESESELIDEKPLNTDVADRVYRQFLTLKTRYPEKILVPSALIDLVWHYHILDTRKYIADCEHLFGSYLHHDPYFGVYGEEDKKENLKAWGETCELWEKEFGEPMLGQMHRCSTKDCR